MRPRTICHLQQDGPALNRIAPMITRNDLAASDESREEMYKLSHEVIRAIRKEFDLPS